MNFLETFEELNLLTEESNGGQYTYKQFLIYLAKFLNVLVPKDCESWDLHHRDGRHNHNNDFDNIVFMEPSDHKSLHGSIRHANYNSDKNNPSPEYSKALIAKLESPTARKGKPYQYFPIGKHIREQLKNMNATQTEQDLTELESGKVG
jgi:hypothetical protein